MKLNKNMKAQMLADAMENIFGKEMDAFNLRCEKLVGEIIPIHEKSAGPFQQMGPEFIQKSSCLRLELKPQNKRRTRSISVFKERKARADYFKGRTHIKAELSPELSLDYVTLKQRTIVKVSHYGRQTIELHELLQKHPAKLRAFQQYVEDREIFINKVKEMKDQLGGLISHCNTLKQLQEVWPDAFDKGILKDPVADEKPMYLPANIVRINELAGIKPSKAKESTS